MTERLRSMAQPLRSQLHRKVVVFPAVGLSPGLFWSLRRFREDPGAISKKKPLVGSWRRCKLLFAGQDRENLPLFQDTDLFFRGMASYLLHKAKYLLSPEKVAAALAPNPSKKHMRLAGVVNGEKNLSSREGFSRSRKRPTRK